MWEVREVGSVVSRLAWLGMKRSASVAVAGVTVAVSPGAFATWSIIAMDPGTGDVGIAAASCVPDSHADGLASLVPGVGVGVTQAAWRLDNRNRLQEALLGGLTAKDVIAEVADAGKDAGSFGETIRSCDPY